MKVYEELIGKTVVVQRIDREVRVGTLTEETDTHIKIKHAKGMNIISKDNVLDIWNDRKTTEEHSSQEKELR